MAKVELEDNSYAAREQVASERERKAENRRRDRDNDDIPEVQKVVKGTAKRKKKTFGRKVLDFITGEDIDKVNEYVKNDVIRPGLLNLIFDVATSTLSMAMFGEVRTSSRRSDSSRSSRRSYDRMYDDRREMSRGRSRRPSYDIDDIIFETQQDARDARSELYDLIDNYGRARVSDLNRAAGLSGTWTDENYGWTRLDRVDIIPVPEGYILDLPPCEDIR